MYFFFHVKIIFPSIKKNKLETWSCESEGGLCEIRTVDHVDGVLMKIFAQRWPDHWKKKIVEKKNFFFFRLIYHF